MFKSAGKIFFVYLPVAIGIVVGFANQKIYALYAGPEQFPAIGDFLNYFQLFTLLSTGGMGVGVIKLIAQYQDQPEKQKQVVSNVLLVVGICILLVLAIMPIAFFTGSLRNINMLMFAFLSGCVIPVALCQVCFSVLNGYNRIVLYNTFQVGLHLLNFGITWFLALNYGVMGIMLSMCLPLAITGLVLGVYMLYTRTLSFHKKHINGSIIRKLVKFSMVSAVIVFLLPFSSVIIRDAMNDQWQATQTGYWQSCMNISRFLISFITAVLPVYFIPRISRNFAYGHVKKELTAILVLFAVFMAFYLGAVVFFGELIIRILFSDAFTQAHPYLVCTAIGDTFRILAIPFSMILLTSEKFGKYLAIELGYYLLVTLFTVFTLVYDLYNVYYCYIGASFLYLLVHAWGFYGFAKKNENIVAG